MRAESGRTVEGTRPQVQDFGEDVLPKDTFYVFFSKFYFLNVNLAFLQNEVAEIRGEN